MSTPTIQPPTQSNPNTNTAPTSYTPTTGQSQLSEQNRHNPLSPESTSIQIPIHVECAQDKKLNETFKVATKYIKSISIGLIIKMAKNHLNSKHSPLEFCCVGFSGKSFISHANTPKSLQNPLTNYNRNHLTDSGINLQMVLQKYVHKINYNPITCPHMLKYYNNNNNGKYIPESCPIYNTMKNQYNYEKAYLLHLKNYNHFINEFGINGKPPCRYASECRAFVRLDNNGLNFDDLCHIQMYRHPPRQNILNLKSNINPLLINTENEQNYPIYEPVENDKIKYKYNEKNGYLKALLKEVIDNGYEECLHLDDDDDDEKNDETYSLLTIVNEKINSLRHKQMNSPLNQAEMLALILYTGTDCNYKLCNKQRKGNYKCWQWFDYCLFNAIRKLSISETAEYKLYSGLSKVKLNKKIVNEGFFKTYVSSSWNLKVAKGFLKKEGGMVIILDKEFRKHTYCCDVSWISKFPDECEVLISRSVQGGFRNNFSLKIMEQDLLHNIQIVSLYYKST